MRTLPTYEINAVPFIVDVDYNLLRHPGNEQIAYGFFRDMKDMGAHYRLCIDTLTFQPLEPDQEHGKPGIGIYDVPHMVKLDPEGTAIKFSMPVSTLPDTDHGLKSNEDLLHRRCIGKPAAIMILGDYFFVDTEKGYLASPGLGAKDWLNVNNMAQDPLRVCYRCLFDPVTRTEYKPGDNKEVPTGIIGLEIPHLKFADSYNYRIVHNLQKVITISDWHRIYPVRSNMEARVIPVEKMGFYLQEQNKADKPALQHSRDRPAIKPPGESSTGSRHKKPGKTL